MTPRAACALALTLAALCAVAIVLASCRGADQDVRLRNASLLTPEALHRVADVLPLLPADPWPCISLIVMGESCPGTSGCYQPDYGRIYAQPATLAHEIAHAAGECAGDYDPEHRAAWWREVDAR